MAKAIIVIGPDRKMLMDSALRNREKLIQSTNLTAEDIHVIHGSPHPNNHVLDKLTERLDLQKADEPLMLIYIGYGNEQGWEMHDQGHVGTIPYPDLATVLNKYHFPIHFINACYYSTAAVPAFQKLLVEKREFGMITPYSRNEGGWEGHFLEMRLMMFFDLHMPYDHAVTNEYGHGLTFGFDPQKPGFAWDKKRKCVRFTVDGKFATEDLTAAGIPARHGKVLDHHFWTFSYKNFKEYSQKIGERLKKQNEARDQRRATRRQSSRGGGYMIVEGR